MRSTWLILTCALASAGQDFESLMPKRDIGEHWTVEGKTPAEAWTVRDGMIACSGQPYGFLRSKRIFRDFVLRAEWRFQEGWPVYYRNVAVKELERKP